MTEENHQRRVVIVGGGFAGLFAVRALRDSASVTLIDRAGHHLFQPLLYQCSTGILSEGKIAAPLRDLLKKHKNVNCVLAEVFDFDVKAGGSWPGGSAASSSSSATTTSSSPAESGSPTSAIPSSPAGHPA